MRCLVFGAYGFIGQAVVHALRKNGWDVIGAGRDLDLGRRLLPDIQWIHCDLNQKLDIAEWTTRLNGIDAIVNCAGVLQSTSQDKAERVHRDGPAVLYGAAERAGVHRIVHISAMSAEENVGTSYSQSKLAGEKALSSLDLNWVIVKPSLVVARGCFGGTSLIRGLAGLPYVTPLPGDAGQRFQPIFLDDLAEGVARLLGRPEPRQTTLYAAGPQVLSVAEIVQKTRHWLGFRPVPLLPLPKYLFSPVLLIGDLLSWIGSRSALTTTSFQQMAVDDVADGGPFAEATGLDLAHYDDFLKDHQATLQDRLHARTYFAEPLLRGLLILFWVMTGVIALTPSGYSAAVSLLMSAGLSSGLAQFLVVGGSFADIALGLMMLIASKIRIAGLLQIGLTLAYLIVLTFVLPGLWSDPLGPLLKAVPLIGAIVVVMALAETR